MTIEERLEALEENSHPPYDFTNLIQQLILQGTEVANLKEQVSELQKNFERLQK
jgi:hypothetical protein